MIIKEDKDQSIQDLQAASTDLERALNAMIEAFVRALDAREKEPVGHTAFVAETTVRLASACGISQAELPNIKLGALLHDIGKMYIPENILLKPAPITEEERKIVRKHSQYAYDLLSPITYIAPALDIPYYHHELWDGSGYPKGLKEDGIPVAARIFAVVDVWDALRSDRPHRKAWPEQKVLEYIQTLSGIYFDPHVVEIFLQMRNKA
jgi:HD-GYP domain-containing protein (c-di-GMP phosphodiesterase class II)